MDRIDQKEPLPPRKLVVFEKRDVNYEEIDANVRGLIRRLNKIPFVSTVSSCEGHLLDEYYMTETIPDNGCMFIIPGHIIFDIDRANPQWQVFFEKVKGLVDKYPFAEIREHHCNEEECKIEGFQCLNLDSEDLTCPETIVESDTLETMVKKRYQVKTPIGKKRIKEFRRFWSELNEIAEEF
jgi:hypothetical protein